MMSRAPLSASSVDGTFSLTNGRALDFGSVVLISQMMSAMFLPADRVNLITGILLIVVLLIDRFTSTKSADE